MIELRKCTGECGLEKELNKYNFYWRNDQKKFNPKCIKCVLLRNDKYYNRNKPGIAKIRKIYRNNNKSKIAEDKNIYNQNHKEEKTRYNKNYYKNNKEKILNNAKIYVENHKEERRAYDRVYRREKIKNDPSYKLQKTCSKLISYGLKSNGGSKNRQSILKYLQYTMKELRKHIEKQFQDPGNEWMNWNNWRKYNPKTWNDNDKSTWVWNIDHIVPQSKLPYKNMECDNFKKCWDLDNLRPYSAKQNIIDGNRR